VSIVKPGPSDRDLLGVLVAKHPAFFMKDGKFFARFDKVELRATQGKVVYFYEGEELFTQTIEGHTPGYVHESITLVGLSGHTEMQIK
jgi:hypothetical protein